MILKEIIQSLFRPATEAPIFDPWWEWDQQNDIDRRNEKIWGQGLKCDNAMIYECI